MDHRFQFNIVTYKSNGKYYAYCSDYLPTMHGGKDIGRLPVQEGKSIEDARDKLAATISKHIRATEEMWVWPINALSVEEKEE